MAPRQVGDGLVREIIGPNGATDAHVDARLTSTIVPAGGQTTVELPRPGEDLFLYMVDGDGQLTGETTAQSLGVYDVLLARPSTAPLVLQAGEKPLNYLSFYLRSFTN